MASWSLIFLLGPILAGFWPTFGSDPLQETFPVEARGAIAFQADAARFRGPDGCVVEVTLSIPRENLGIPGDSSRIWVEIQPLDRRKRALARFRTDLTLPPPPPRGPGDFPVSRAWLRLSPRWVEGTVGLRVHLEDPERHKIGLYDRLRDKHPEGEAAARIIPQGDPAALGPLSDLLFVWGPSGSADAADPGRGLRAVRARLEPNPYRYYGLFQSVLTVYWERYAAGRDSTGRIVETRRVIQLADSLEVAAERETLTVGPADSWTLHRYDLSGLPGGAYRYEVTWERPGDAGVVQARAGGDFQVIWEKESWVRLGSELRDIASVILPAPEFERYDALDRGGQETFFREFWNRHAAPGPGGRSPLERVFEERRDHADRSFPGQRRGMLSDRGRVYIRLGAPDEVKAQLNPQDEELLWLALPDEISADDRELTLEARRRLSRKRTPFDNSAYETWEYITRGDPLLPEYIRPGQKLGMKFIFVDETGTGDYVLVYTNAPGVLQ